MIDESIKEEVNLAQQVASDQKKSLEKTDDHQTEQNKPKKSLWRNRDFNIFWFGQSLSAVGDAFAIIAFPLLVLQVTGSVAQMGLVTGTYGLFRLLAGLVAGVVVDRVDRRKLMIICDVGRAILYCAIPLGWWMSGPQIWLIYFVMAIGAVLGMFFQVTYITAVPNLLEKEELHAGMSRLQVTMGFAFVLGPTLAGVISGYFGPSAAIGIDALSFVVSFLSLLFIKLHNSTAVRPHGEQVKHPFRDWQEGISFLLRQPILRTLTILFFCSSIMIAGAIDLFIYHVKNDLGQSDNIVGISFGLSSIGAIIGGLIFPTLRKRLGFGFCIISGIILGGVAIGSFGQASSIVVLTLVAILFVLMQTIWGTSSMTVRQQITPDHLLGRVTAIFFTLIDTAGPLGAALTTGLATLTGAPLMLEIMGGGVVTIGIVAVFTPVRLRNPEEVYKVTTV